MAAMHSIAHLTARDVATAFDLSQFKSACDLGGIDCNWTCIQIRGKAWFQFHILLLKTYILFYFLFFFLLELSNIIYCYFYGIVMSE